MARIDIYLRFVTWLCLQNTQNIHMICLNDNVVVVFVADNVEQS